MLWDFTKTHGYSPVLYDVASFFEISVVSSHERISTLLKKGAIKKRSKSNRSYCLSTDYIKKFIKNSADKKHLGKWIYLSKKQWEIVSKIQSAIKKSKKKISVRQLGEELGVSRANVFSHISSLIDKGALIRDEKSKKLKLTERFTKQVNFVNYQKRKKCPNDKSREVTTSNS